MVSSLADDGRFNIRIDQKSIRILVLDGRTSGEIEEEWSNKIGAGELDSVAIIWFGHDELVQPQSYKKYTKIEDARKFASSYGFGARFRKSGGGLVPQGDGILNFSIIFRTELNASELAADVYLYLGSIIKRTFSYFGMETNFREVPQAFCDGKYNLATLHQGVIKKIVGTAQYWKKYNKTNVVLAHALILISIDRVKLCSLLNGYEEKLGSDTFYDANSIVDFSTLYAEKNTSILNVNVIKELFVNELINQINGGL